MRYIPLALLAACAVLPASAQRVVLDNGSLTLGSGTLTVRDTLDVGVNGRLNEVGGRLVSPATTDPISVRAPTALDIGGLGFVITSAQNPGIVTVTRIPEVQTGVAGVSIARAYDVTAETNTGLDATVVFRYDDTELNGLDESTLSLFRSTDDGATWTEVGGTVDPDANTITATNVDGFSLWTAAASGALPVELVAFTATADGDGVWLRWTTASESNNAGFGVERETTSGWTEAAFVAGRGTTSEQTSYTRRVAGLAPGTHRFRLRQIDTDGAATLSATVEALLGLDAPTLLEVWGPRVRFAVAAAGPARVEVFSVLGQRVAVLHDGALGAATVREAALPGDLARGVYVVRLTAAGHVATAPVVVR